MKSLFLLCWIIDEVAFLIKMFCLILPLIIKYEAYTKNNRRLVLKKVILKRSTHIIAIHFYAFLHGAALAFLIPLRAAA